MREKEKKQKQRAREKDKRREYSLAFQDIVTRNIRCNQLGP